jgi:hypothetical protein
LFRKLFLHVRRGWVGRGGEGERGRGGEGEKVRGREGEGEMGRREVGGRGRREKTIKTQPLTWIWDCV